MRVILQEKITKLGNVGDLVTVKAGYCRNYLVPQGKAVYATEDNVKAFEVRRAELEKKEQERIESAKQRAEELSKLTITIISRASEEGKLFGSVTPREIAEAATLQKIDLHKSEVHLPEGPIRMTGEYTVDVSLHGDVHSTVKVVVEAEK